MFGLTFEKLLLIGIIAVFLLGPDRLPYYAQKLADLVKSLRKMATGAKERMREELGPDFDDVDWQKLDPRQYDPRRIIREALLDDEPPPRVVRPRTPVETPAAKRARLARERAEDRAADPVAGDSVPGDPLAGSVVGDSVAGDSAGGDPLVTTPGRSASPVPAPYDSEAT